MFQRIFGASKKDKSKERARKSSSSGRDANSEDPESRSGSTAAAATRDEVKSSTAAGNARVGMTRTTSPTAMARRQRSGDQRSVVSSQVQSPSASPPLTTTAVGADARGAANLSLAVRSDPVPAPFKMPATTSVPSSPVRSVGISGTSATGAHGLVHDDPTSTFARPGSSATGHNGSPLSSSLRAHSQVQPSRSHPVLASANTSHQRNASDGADLVHGRSSPAYEGSPLLSRSATRGSFAANSSLVRATTSGSDSVNYWRLPWTQQRVVMCPFCGRPQRPRAAASAASSDDEDDDEESRSADSRARSSDSEHSSGAGTGAGGEPPSRPYCRCSKSSQMATRGDSTGKFSPSGSGVVSANGTGSPSGTAVQSPVQAPPPVFIVETKRSANITVPGTIADDASSSDDEDLQAVGGRRKGVKLSLVSPLTSSALLRNGSMAVGSSTDNAGRQQQQQQHQSGPRGEGKSTVPSPPPAREEADSPPSTKLTSGAGDGADGGLNSVASWVREQRQSTEGKDSAPLNQETPN